MKKASLDKNKNIDLIIGTKNDLEEVFMIWEELESKSSSKNVFASLDFMKPLILSYFNHEHLFFVIILRKGEPIFLTPLINKLSFVHGVLVNMLRSCVNEEVPVFSCLMRKGEDVYELWSYFINVLFGYLKWDVFIRKHVYIEDDTCSCFCKATADKKKMFLKVAKFSSPLIKTYGKSWDEYLTTLSHNAREDFRRKQAKFRASEGSRLEIYTNFDSNLSKAIDDMFAIAEKGWAAKKKTAISSTDSSRNFYKQMAISFAQKGNLRLYILKVKDKPVAFMLHIIYKRIFNFLKTAYDPAHEHLSPGTILLSAAIKDCFDMRLEEFNLCGIIERYKVRWANAHREIGDVFIFNDTLLGKIAYFQEKTVVPILRKAIYYK